MKKTFATLIIILGIGNTFAFNSANNDSKTEPTKTYKTFTSIDISELPGYIQETIFFEYKDYIVRSVEVKTVRGINIYQITLVDNENFEYIVYINDKGTIME